jgi:hypothetical protein
MSLVEVLQVSRGCDRARGVLGFADEGRRFLAHESRDTQTTILGGVRDQEGHLPGCGASPIRDPEEGPGFRTTNLLQLIS